VKRLIEGATDVHGNPVKTYAPPVDLPIRGIAPGAMLLPGEADRDVSEILWTLTCSTHPNLPGDLDLVMLDGDDYALAGRVKDWTRGPWPNPAAGCVIELKRVEG
jgi:hypothetical protein